MVDTVSLEYCFQDFHYNTGGTLLTLLDRTVTWFMPTSDFEALKKSL